MASFELVPGRLIGEGHPCFIIAEIGQNHQGDINIAKRMIEAAKECGVDCVKFQKTCLEQKFNGAALQRPYVGPHSWGPTYGEHKRNLEFSESQFRELKAFSDHLGIPFTASGMDTVSMDFLNSLGVPFFKIGSGDTNNFPLLAHVAKKGKPMIVSSGMQTMKTMRRVYQTLTSFHKNFCFLQCTSAYPTDPKDANLRVIQSYQKEFLDIPIGYSGHETGISISLAAVALGAKVLERHFTLDHSWKGSDHSSSLEPDELRDLVREVRVVEAALGTSKKDFLPSEIPCYTKLGKTLVASTVITKGQKLTADMVTIKVAEPKGLRAERWEEVLGATSRRTIECDESVMEEDLIL